MIKADLVSRKEALQQCPALASLITDIQQSQYNDWLDDDDIDSAAIRKLEAQMDSVNAADLEYYGGLKFGVDPGITEQPLIHAIESVFSELGVEELIFLPEYNVAWLGRSNPYPQAKVAINHVREIIKKKAYAGGVKVSKPDLGQFLTHIFWISRCCADSPLIFFSAVGHEAVYNICKYGIFHVSVYDPELYDRMIGAAETAGLIETEKCFDILDETVIRGRQTSI